MSVGLPAVGSVHPNDASDPYLAVSLTVEPAIVANLLADWPEPTVIAMVPASLLRTSLTNYSTPGFACCV